MTKEFSGMSYVQLVDHITEALAELKRKSYGEGYRQGRMDAIPEPVISKPKPLTRAEVVRKAKADIEALKDEMTGDYIVNNYCNYADFIVNNEKRTVVVLLRGICSNRIRAKGIAKCAPGDCFNADLGKAIALRRALNLEVPSEYLNAPKPEGIEVGDVITFPKDDRWYHRVNYRVNTLEMVVGNLTIVKDEIDLEIGEKATFDFEEFPGSGFEVIDDSARNY